MCVCEGGRRGGGRGGRGGEGRERGGREGGRLDPDPKPNLSTKPLVLCILTEKKFYIENTFVYREQIL